MIGPTRNNAAALLLGLLATIGCGSSTAHGAPRADCATEIVAHRLSGVTSVTLVNGVLVHHRAALLPSGRVLVSVAMAGGEREETEANRGVTELAAAVLDRPATRTESSAQLSARLQRIGIRTAGVSLPDALVLQIDAPSARLDEAMALAGDLLTRTRAEEKVIALAADARASRRTSEPLFIADCLRRALDEEEHGPPAACTSSVLRQRSTEQVQACLDEHATHRSIEVAVVGQVTLASVLELAGERLGTLPERSRPEALHIRQNNRLLSPSAQAPTPAGDAPRGVREFSTPTPQGRTLIVVGFPGAPMSDSEGHRTLRAAAEILRRRTSDRLRERGIAGWGKSAGTVIPSPLNPCVGLVITAASVDPAQERETLEVLSAAVDDLPLTPPTSAELRDATEELAQASDVAESDSRYWSGLLAVCTLRGIDPDRAAGGAAFYRGVTPERVTQAAGRFLTPAGVGGGGRILVVVRPDASQLPPAP